uniref:Uncharacterized protein n=1 Tax=Steinernema glaseri TaxID=37863 RepID=A0A1I7YAD6_9BILA
MTSHIPHSQIAPCRNLPFLHRPIFHILQKCTPSSSWRQTPHRLVRLSLVLLLPLVPDPQADQCEQDAGGQLS